MARHEGGVQRIDVQGCSDTDDGAVDPGFAGAAGEDVAVGAGVLRGQRHARRNLEAQTGDGDAAWERLPGTATFAIRIACAAVAAARPGAGESGRGTIA